MSSLVSNFPFFQDAYFNNVKDDEALTLKNDEIKIQKDIGYTFETGIMNSGEGLLCVQEIFCASIGSSEVPAAILSDENKEEEFNPTTYPFVYNAQVSYYCGLGRALLTPSKELVTRQNLTCGWDGTWQPSDEIFDCQCESISSLDCF